MKGFRFTINKRDDVPWAKAYEIEAYPGLWPIREERDGTCWIVSDRHWWHKPITADLESIGPFDSPELAIAAYFLLHP